MQVVGLPGHIIRAGKVASRIAAQSPNNEAANRRAAVARWRQAMADGLTAEDGRTGATAVGISRASLYRWHKRAEPRSKRPRRMRANTWTPALVEAVEARRLDHPMWGKTKLGPVLRRQGFAVSDSTVGRILAYLGGRGVVERVHCAGARAQEPAGGAAKMRCVCPKERSRHSPANSFRSTLSQ